MGRHRSWLPFFPQSQERAQFAVSNFRSLHPSETWMCFVWNVVKSIKYSPAPEYLAKLQAAIEEAQGRSSLHEATWMGVEQSDSRLWSGSVEIFRLEEPAPARRAFAWGKVEDSQLHCYVVLEQPGVESPQAAVRYTLAQETEDEELALAS